MIFRPSPGSWPCSSCCAAVLPLTLFGIVSVWQARSTAREVVLTGNMRVAARAADQIHQYLENSVAILRSTAENVGRADLAPWQRERVVRNMAQGFEEFSEILLTDAQGTIVSSSGVGASRVMATPHGAEAIHKALAGEGFFSPVFITDEFVPAMIVALPMRALGDVVGTVAAEVDPINMWRLADRIRIGKEGYLSVMEPDREPHRLGRRRDEAARTPGTGLSGQSGAGRARRRGERTPHHEAERRSARPARRGSKAPRALPVARGARAAGGRGLRPCAPPHVDTDGARRHLPLRHDPAGIPGRVRQIIRPVGELISGTRRIAAGDLAHRVRVASRDELGQLASSFNQMAGDLALMQENIRKHERLAFFGRIASGLAHDLKHPIRSIENASQNLEKMYDDPAYRETFRRIVEREFAKVNAFLENLHTLSHDIPYQPIEIPLHALLDEVVDTFAMEAQKQGVAIEKSFAAGQPKIYADKFSMTRASRTS